jgi:putative transposase
MLECEVCKKPSSTVFIPLQNKKPCCGELWVASGWFITERWQREWSWGELVRQLAYKCQWYGRELIKIDRWFPSSKRCGNCGHIVDKMPLSLREWDCPKCGINHDRDINASQNILAAGLAVSVCGANIRPDRQESKGRLQKTRKGKKQKLKS